jgi:IrrE N-terminal-like domain
MSSVRQAHCKAQAHELLKKLWIESPDEIDLVALAHQAGPLRIEDGGLENADYVLHPREGLDRDDTAKNFRVWNDPGEEAEANLFAAELLMPEFLFKPRAKKTPPSLASLDRLSSDFSMSTMATAFQYATHTIEQVALVVSVGGKVKWFYKAKDFGPHIRTGALHPHSAAGETAAGKSGDTKKMVPVSAYAWLSGFENDNRKEIMEDSRYLGWYDCIITLLWLYNDLDED